MLTALRLILHLSTMYYLGLLEPIPYSVFCLLIASERKETLPEKGGGGGGEGLLLKQNLKE